MNTIFKKVMLAAVVLPLTISSVYAKPGGYGCQPDGYGGHHMRGFGGHHMHGYAGMQGMPFYGMLGQLDLTAEQQKKVDAIIETHRSQANRGAFHNNMMAILKSEKFDEQQAQAVIEAKEALRDARQLQHMQMMHEVYQTLNTEQKAKMDELFSQHQQQMLSQGKGQGKGPGAGQGKGPGTGPMQNK